MEEEMVVEEVQCMLIVVVVEEAHKYSGPAL
jgi:hypothetical protein